MHFLMTKGIGNRLFLAPVDLDKSSRVLDIGTGTGIWAISVGEEYPNAEVIGNDLSAIQSTWVPPNVKFEIDDVEQPWVNGNFDYIFSRYMSTSILDWPKLAGNVFEHLNPGGWAEFQDLDLLYYSEDGSITDEHYLMKWIKLFIDTARTKLNREPCPGPKLEGWVKDAGFKNVVHRKFRLPLGSWPKDPHMKDIGMCNIAQLLEGLEAFSLKIFCGVLGMSTEEVLVMLAKVRQELHARAFHAQFDFHVVYGQKP
ncbi:UMTA methyltransferase [Dactylonectria macrodidyma]|uniref:UMTA methyltransferase n=1 Tax=Dactylonectria macrodidyma TaxID=307937 RepID=A0A9P9JGS9_9HYPO|nr:UMTA methyltransferase [Dactylonectria macrodidyma]